MGVSERERERRRKKEWVSNRKMLSMFVFACVFMFAWRRRREREWVKISRRAVFKAFSDAAAKIQNKALGIQRSNKKERCQFSAEIDAKKRRMRKRNSFNMQNYFLDILIKGPLRLARNPGLELEPSSNVRRLKNFYPGVEFTLSAKKWRYRLQSFGLRRRHWAQMLVKDDNLKLNLKIMNVQLNEKTTLLPFSGKWMNRLLPKELK